MSRSLLFLVLLACLVAGFPGRALARDLGTLTRKEQVVKKAPRGQAETDMAERETVQEWMEVSTKKHSGAEFTIGRGQGVVTMGPESTFTFEEGQFDDAGQLVDRLSLNIAFGRFWLWLVPPVSKPTVLGRHPREVLIKSGGEDIRLSGTAVFLHVERNGMTTLYVEEGTAVVGEPGAEVRVEQGQVTTFGPGLPPQPPAPIDRQPTTEPFRPGESDITGPVLLDPASPRLDLPKSGFMWFP